MCRPRESVRISENVPNTLPELVEHYLSPRGAQETDGGLQDLLRRGRPWEAAQASRWRRWKAPPWARGERWVKAAETELTRNPQPQVPQALSEQTALSPLEVCVRGNSGERSITQNL